MVLFRRNLKMRGPSCKNTYSTLRSKLVFENRAACEIMWKNIEEPVRAHVTILRMLIACWIMQTQNM
jgi:hypothetical protein